jgi:chromosome segregation ATPase
MENENAPAAAAGTNESETDGQKLESENLKLENQDLKRELESRQNRIAGLEKSLAEKDRELSAAQGSVIEGMQAVKESVAAFKKAVTAYRELAGQANPGLVAEMIKGETITDIDASVKQARELVDKVRREIEAGNARVRVPAGAPPRVMPDSGALTAREKIKLAVEGR